MTYKLFIDDERFPPSSWNETGECVIARTSDEATNYIQYRGMPNFISFDHDLGVDDTAMRFIDNLTNMLLDGFVEIQGDFEFYVHSQNPVGAENIRAKMSSIVNHFKRG